METFESFPSKYIPRGRRSLITSVFQRNFKEKFEDKKFKNTKFHKLKYQNF